jgi:hypothetical protein
MLTIELIVCPKNMIIALALERSQICASVSNVARTAAGSRPALWAAIWCVEGCVFSTHQEMARISLAPSFPCLAYMLVRAPTH